ncbi:MAG: 2-amino-4-hydroxy-6-hydroxymethyldihydropteridine diphosphokinase [Candidatus Adiutrix sp.]
MLLNNVAMVGLGANLENPLGHIKSALTLLAETPGVQPLAVSGVYLTEPQGGPKGQNWFHNAVALMAHTYTPACFLKRLFEIENILGRQRQIRWGPRLIDLDYLAQGAQIINDGPDLFLPHPWCEARLFVMAPLAELAPQWVHPVSGQTAIDTASQLLKSGEQKIERLNEDISGFFKPASSQTPQP